MTNTGHGNIYLGPTTAGELRWHHHEGCPHNGEVLTEARSTPSETPNVKQDEEAAIHRIIDVIDNDEGAAELYEAALMLYRARLRSQESDRWPQSLPAEEHQR